MTALIIIAAIILFLVLIFGFLPLHARLVYRDDFTVYFGVLFLKFKVFPQKEKKLKMSDFRSDRIAKKKKKLKKKKSEVVEKAHDAKKEEKLKKSLTRKAAADALFAAIREFYSVMTRGGLLSPKIKIYRLHINVSAGDAAKTAIAYGGATAALNCLLAYFNENTRLVIKGKNALSIIPDYTAEKFSAEVDIDFSVLSGQLLKIAFAAAGAYLKKMINPNK